MRKQPSPVVSSQAVERLNAVLPKNTTLYIVQVDRDDRREEVKVLFTGRDGKPVNLTDDCAKAGVGPVGRSCGILMHDTPAKFVAAKIETRINQKLSRTDLKVAWL